MAKSFKKTANKKTKAIAKKRTKELTREVIYAKMIFGELTFGEFYRFLCKSLHNRQPPMVLFVKEENEFYERKEFYSHSFELEKEHLNLYGTRSEGGNCFASIPFAAKVKIKDDVVEITETKEGLSPQLRLVGCLTFFHEPQSIDVLKRISGS